MQAINEFQRTLETDLNALLARRGLYLVKRLVHQATQSEEVFISASIAGTSLEVWIYEDEAQFFGDGSDCRFEAPDYDTPEDLKAAFLEGLERCLIEGPKKAEKSAPGVLNKLLNFFRKSEPEERQ